MQEITAILNSFFGSIMRDSHLQIFCYDGAQLLSTSIESKTEQHMMHLDSEHGWDIRKKNDTCKWVGDCPLMDGNE